MNHLVTNQDFSGHTYQHIQGCMLLALNKLAPALKLSHTDYRIMCTLIGYWNKQQGKAYPSTRQLVKDCQVSNTTLKKSLTALKTLNLIVIVRDSKTRRQNYYINQKNLFNLETGDATPPVTPLATPCDSTHEQTNRKKQIEQTSKTNDDLSIKMTSLPEYKQTLEQLNTWGVLDAKKIIAREGLEKVKNIIKVVEAQKPRNAGAYLRSLLKVSGHLTPDSKRGPFGGKELPLINQMVKSKFWQHLPTGRVLQVLPEIGEHLLIKYYKEENMVTFFETGLTDSLESFEPV